MYVITRTCPIECLAPLLSRKTFSALAAGMQCSPATVGQVIELYEQGQLQDIENISTGRAGGGGGGGGGMPRCPTDIMRRAQCICARAKMELALLNADHALICRKSIRRLRRHRSSAADEPSDKVAGRSPAAGDDLLQGAVSCRDLPSLTICRPLKAPRSGVVCRLRRNWLDVPARLRQGSVIR